jgi:hypothetical protein
MKKLFIILSATLLTVSFANAQTGKTCDPAKEANYKSLSNPNSTGGYGAVITKDKALAVSDVEKQMKAKNVTEMKNVKVTGKVNSVCKMKGCWMEIADGKGGNTRVRFKNYEFFVPRDCENQTVSAQGVARFDTTSVAMLKHYAEDAGKSKKEIAAITQPEVSLTFEAEGVLFDKK